MAKAAYRSGEALWDERTQQLFDYTDGAGRVVGTRIMVRSGVDAPESRETFWNAAEAAEARKNGRIATEFQIGLPHELSKEQRDKLLYEDFLGPIIERYGVAADVSIHFADDWRNIHAHILLTHREYGPDGFGEIANSRMESRKRNGEFVREKKAGISASPADVKMFRELWANCVNRAYEQAGYNIRVDHRSFEDRGIKEPPTIHHGPKVTALERGGIRTDRGDINREIMQQRAQRRELEESSVRDGAEIIYLQTVLAERLAPQPPRKDEAEKNYSKRQGDEITARKDEPMPAQEPDSSPVAANQNGLEIDKAAFDVTHPDAALREAWRQPAFSAASIEADPWTAVYLAIPQTPDAALLRKGLEAVVECREMIVTRPGTGPQMPQGDHGPADNAIAASDRFHELAQCIETMLRVREPFEERQAPFSPSSANAGRYDELRPAPEARPEPTAAAVEKAATEAVEAYQGQAAPVAQPEAITPTSEPQRAAQAANSGEIDPAAAAAAFQQKMIDIQLERRDEAIRARVLASENREAEQAASAFDAGLSKAVYEFADTVSAVARKAERTASHLLASAAALVEDVFTGLGNVLASPFRSTELEREVAPKVAEERAQEAAVGEAYRQYLAEYDERHEAQKQAQQTRDLNSTLGYDHDGQSHEPE
jgi:hypothetical protein